MESNQPIPSDSHSSNYASITLAVVLVCMAAVGNSLVTFILWEEGEEFVICFFCGLLIAQPCLLSIWCAAVKQRLIVRVSLTVGILLTLLMLYLLTLSSQDQRMPLEVPIVCFGIVAVLSSMIQIPLLVLRGFTSQAISISHVQPPANTDRQFGIKHLMIATAIVALLVVLAQKTLATLGFEGDAPWVEILTFLASLTVFTSAICLLSFGLVFLKRIRIASGVGLAMVVIIGSVAVYWVLTTAGRFDASSDVMWNILAYAIGLTGTINAVMVGFYLIGFRMRTLAD